MHLQCYRKRFTDKTYSKDNQTLMLSEVIHSPLEPKKRRKMLFLNHDYLKTIGLGLATKYDRCSKKQVCAKLFFLRNKNTCTNYF